MAKKKKKKKKRQDGEKKWMKRYAEKGWEAKTDGAGARWGDAARSTQSSRSKPFISHNFVLGGSTAHNSWCLSPWVINCKKAPKSRESRVAIKSAANVEESSHQKKCMRKLVFKNSMGLEAWISHKVLGSLLYGRKSQLERRTKEFATKQRT